MFYVFIIHLNGESVKQNPQQNPRKNPENRIVFGNGGRVPGRIAWTPRTDYKRSLRNLTFEWGAKKQLAIETGIAESTISNWAQFGSTALPNVEQGYFIARSLGQNLLDMIGGNVVPRLLDPITRAARLLYGLPRDQQRLAIGTIEAFARSAGISEEARVQGVFVRVVE